MMPHFRCTLVVRCRFSEHQLLVAALRPPATGQIHRGGRILRLQDVQDVLHDGVPEVFVTAAFPNHLGHHPTGHRRMQRPNPGRVQNLFALRRFPLKRGESGAGLLFHVILFRGGDVRQALQRLFDLRVKIFFQIGDQLPANSVPGVLHAIVAFVVVGAKRVLRHIVFNFLSGGGQQRADDGVSLLIRPSGRDSRQSSDSGTSHDALQQGFALIVSVVGQGDADAFLRNTFPQKLLRHFIENPVPRRSSRLFHRALLRPGNASAVDTANPAGQIPFPADFRRMALFSIGVLPQLMVHVNGNDIQIFRRFQLFQNMKQCQRVRSPGQSQNHRAVFWNHSALLYSFYQSVHGPFVPFVILPRPLECRRIGSRWRREFLPPLRIPYL